MTPWCRLWHDMPTDPKFRAIARRAGAPISEVISVFILMMNCASQSDERGTLDGWDDEDAAAALDIDAERVCAIRGAMQGKVLDGNYLSGWEKRQPKREREESETSTERSREFRARKAAQQAHPVADSPQESRQETPPPSNSGHTTPCNAMQRHATPPEIDIEVDTEREYISTSQVPLSESRGVVGGRGKRANAAASRGSRLPAGFVPSNENWEWAGREYPDVDTAAQTDAFCDYWRSKAGKDGVKLDWQATWRNWIRRAAEYSARRQAPTPSRASPLPPRETAFQAARRRNLEIIAEWGAEMDAAIDEQEQRLQEQMAAQSRQEQSNGHDEPTDATPFAARSDGYGIVLSPVAAAPARAGRSADLIAGRDGLRRAGATLERLGYAGTRGFDA